MVRPGYRTYGEAFLDRRLHTEHRAGVPHYVPGQVACSIERDVDEETGDEVYAAMYSYVDQMGHACAVMFVHDGAWHPILMGRAGVATEGYWRSTPECFVPSAEMLKTVNDKLEEARHGN